MDSSWKFLCNTFECRKVLDIEAVVTTCCHIYCTQCAKDQGLLDGRRICPACHGELPNQDDLAIASMKPSTDYKASVLCGLNPMDIIECAQKALYFYQYQALHEVLYQKFVVDNLEKITKEQHSRISAIKSQRKLEEAELLQRAEKAENRIRVMNQDRAKQDQEAKAKDRQIEKLRRELSQIKQATVIAPRMAQAAAAEVEAEAGHRRCEAHGRPRNSVKSGPPYFERNNNDTHSRSSGPPFGIGARNRRPEAPSYHSRGGPVAPVATPMETPQHTRTPVFAQPIPHMSAMNHSTRNPLEDLDANVCTHMMGAYGTTAGAKISRNGAYGEGTAQVLQNLSQRRW